MCRISGRVDFMFFGIAESTFDELWKRRIEDGFFAVSFSRGVSSTVRACRTMGKGVIFAAGAFSRASKGGL